MSPPEARNPIALGLEKSNLAQAQDKDVKVDIMNMFRDLKEDRKKNPLMKSQKNHS